MIELIIILALVSGPSGFLFYKNKSLKKENEKIMNALNDENFRDFYCQNSCEGEEI